jgi:hypothetical protein
VAGILHQLFARRVCQLFESGIEDRLFELGMQCEFGTDLVSKVLIGGPILCGLILLEQILHLAVISVQQRDGLDRISGGMAKSTQALDHGSTEILICLELGH